MPQPLDLRGRAIITDAGATRTLRSIQSGMAAVGRQGAAMSTVMANAGKSAATTGRRVQRMTGGMAGTGMGTMAAAAGGAAFLRNEYDFQSAMNRTQAVLNITNEKAFRPHRDLVVDLAKRYPTTSAEIAKGASELAMSGMSLKQVNAVLEATVQGSMASGESIKTVGMGVTDVVMGLGKALTQSNFLEVNNTLAAASTSYAQNYTQFLSGLAKTAPLARVTGTSLKQVTGMLGILANAGFKAEKGGTALRTMMIRMGAPTPKALANLKKYGIALKDFRGKFDGAKIGGKKGAKTLTDMLFENGLDASGASGSIERLLSNKKLLGDSDSLRRALVSTLTNELGLQTDGPTGEMLAESVNAFVSGGFKNLDVMGFFRALGKAGGLNDLEALSSIFGLRFSAQASSIMASMFTVDPTTGKSVFDATFANFESRIPGAVKRFADILMKGLPGALKRLGGAFDGLMRAMASSGAMDTVINALNGLRDGILWLSDTSPGFLKFVTIAGLAVAVLAPLGFIASGIGAGFATLAAAAAAVASPLGAIAALGAAFVAVNWTGVTSFLSGFSEGFMAMLKPAEGVSNALGTVFGWLGKLAGPLAASAETWRSWGKMVGQAVALPFRAINELIGLVAKLGSMIANTGAGRWLFGSGASVSGSKSNRTASGGPAMPAAGATASVPSVAGAVPAAGAVQAGKAGGAAEAEARQSVSRVKSILAGVDLSAEGRRMMSTLAAGMRAGIPEIEAAVRSAASRARSAAQVNLNTGPSMRPAQ